MDFDEEHSYSVHSSSLAGNSDAKWKEFDSVVQTFMKEQDVPGASVAICKNQEVLYTQGYGSAGASKRVNPDSFFRIASISKPITAFTVLNLCLDHDVTLDSKVFGKKGILKTYKYKDKRVSSITIRHLLQHSAGWDRDIAGDLAFVRPALVARCDPEGVEHNRALLSYTLRKRLQFKPGTRHAYSNLCYLVLGLVIEEVSSASFSSYLDQVLAKWGISNIHLGSPWRADWTSTEVEYFNNREPFIVPSLHPGLGELLPQYGGLAMASAAAYGGLVANAVSLIRFMNVIENLALKECKDMDNDDNGHLIHSDVTISDLVKESLHQPDFESGYDWYGLGWDVQDKGKSWGHTGGMEGTSCILFRHVSGMSWVLLLNAWAKDIDLNGVVKCAISRIPNLGLFDCDMSLSGELKSFWECKNQFNNMENGRVVITKDKSQIIFLGIDEATVYKMTALFKIEGYLPIWISTIKNELNFSVINPSSRTMTTCLKNESKFYTFKLRYIIIFSSQKQHYEDYVLMLDKGNKEILEYIREKGNLGYFVNFIDSFCDLDGNLKFSVVLIKCDNCTNVILERAFHLGLKANAYVGHIKSWAKSHYILCQSVTEIGDELFVSVLLEKRMDIDKDDAVTNASSYWVQIEPESFLTELSRKINQISSLTYAKFFNVGGESYVSGCWTNGCASNVYHRISMSKYGLFPELADAAAENVQLLSVSEYEDDSVVYYAGLWIVK